MWVIETLVRVIKFIRSLVKISKGHQSSKFLPFVLYACMLYTNLQRNAWNFPLNFHYPFMGQYFLSKHNLPPLLNPNNWKFYANSPAKKLIFYPNFPNKRVRRLCLLDLACTVHYIHYWYTYCVLITWSGIAIINPSQ